MAADEDRQLRIDWDECDDSPGDDCGSRCDWCWLGGDKRYQGIWRVRWESRPETSLIIGGVNDAYSSGGFESKLSFD